MHRLVKAINKVIGLHRSAFIEVRLIDVNIRTIQYLFARRKTSRAKLEEDRSIFFLDQEKAYDLISHDFMWTMLRHIEIPEIFIKWIQTLYLGARTKIHLNGNIGPDSGKKCRSTTNQ